MILLVAMSDVSTPIRRTVHGDLTYKLSIACTVVRSPDVTSSAVRTANDVTSGDRTTVQAIESLYVRSPWTVRRMGVLTSLIATNKIISRMHKLCSLFHN